MDAKSKADFINSVAEGQVVLCPRCGTSNKPDSKFCAVCGTGMSSENAFDPVPTTESVFPSVDEEKTETDNAVKYEEPASVFAQGLPDWDMVPPQVVVRRH